MDEIKQPRVAKWPFFLGDACLLGLAYFIYWQRPTPLPLAELIAGGICILLGAALAVAPFILEHKAALKALELGVLGTVAEKIQNLETLSAHIGSATSHWQMAHDDAEKTSAAARQIADQMATELKDFKEFLQKANDNEKSTLRLEVDKLRRTEADWLQTMVRLLDHVFALHVAAERSGQPQLAGQINGFQNACRDTIRKVGLIPFVAAPGEKFDSKRHQTAGGDQPEGEALVGETLATGFTFQGRQIRPALVKLAGTPGATAAASPSVESGAQQPRLPLEAPQA